MTRHLSALLALAVAACASPSPPHVPDPPVPDAGDEHAQEVAFCARACTSSCTPDDHGGSNFACTGAPGDACETRCVARCEDGRTGFCSRAAEPRCGDYPLHCIPVAGVKPDAGYEQPDSGTPAQACRRCHVRCVDFSGPAICASSTGSAGCEQCRPRCTGGDWPVCSSLMVSCAAGSSVCEPR